MKKILPLLLCIVIAVTLTACKKNVEPETTQNITVPLATTSLPNPVDTQPTTASADGGYVLTTQPGETVPTLTMPSFENNLVDVTDPTVSTIPGQGLTIPDVTVPVVVTDTVPTTTTAASTTEKQSSTGKTTDNPNSTEPSQTTVNDDISNNESTDASGHGSTTGAADTTNPRESDTADNKPLVSQGTACNSRGDVVVMFDYSGWDRIKSQRARCIVSCNGKRKVLEGTVNGVDDGSGLFEFTVDISDFKPTDGDYIEIQFSKGAVESFNGKQKSAAVTVSMYYTA